MPEFSTYLHDLPPKASSFAAPARFTFPFYYRPHPMAATAAEDLQAKLRGPKQWEYDFGLDEATAGGRGKMFGVLVVRKDDRYCYLAAHSGKVAESNELPGFVPPVFDLLLDDGFYRVEEQKINDVSTEIQKKKTSDEYCATLSHLAVAQSDFEQRIAGERSKVKQGKATRKRRRLAAAAWSEQDRLALETELAAESIRDSYALKDLTRALKLRVARAQTAVDKPQQEIDTLTAKRSAMSNALQQRIFEHYTFLNAYGEARDLGDIFQPTVFGVPPAGAGECAAPKLLQFAYLHGLQPVALAEFWWGQSPASEIRNHRHYYPACKGKCEPILGHMLLGLSVDPNPMLENPAAGKKLTTVFEDDYLLVIDKPADFLSVPGRNIEDSVWLRIKKRYPQATGPLIVHRLDMSTSGLMLVTKTKEAHKRLQQQFFKRSVKKRYVALLDGEVSGESGTIDLPLRGDLDDRPRQIVCHKHGKTARSHWQVIGRWAGQTLVHLWPVTGRTHQLRVHCAHPDGLNACIIGDDLYGQPGDRLCLHAEQLTFRHPLSKAEMTFEAPAGFELHP